MNSRTAFDAPRRKGAFDLLELQKPEATLGGIVNTAQDKLDIPTEHFTGFVAKYKEFKRREDVDPIHPYALELAKLLPHFLLVGLFGLTWYGEESGDRVLGDYLRHQVTDLLLSPFSLLWAIPLLLGLIGGLFANAFRHYRLLTWSLWSIGCFGLGASLLTLDTPNSGTFVFVKGLVAALLFTEGAASLLPIITTPVSKWIQDRVVAVQSAPRILRILNALNVSATRPASVIWLSLRYHFQPSVPSGGVVAMTQAVISFFLLAAVFLNVGGWVTKEVLRSWFVHSYHDAETIKLVLAAGVFWAMMYLLRFGAYSLIVSIFGALARWPLKTMAAALAAVFLGLVAWNPSVARWIEAEPGLTYAVTTVGLSLLVLEESVLDFFHRRRANRRVTRRKQLEWIRSNRHRNLSIVFTGGDALSARKLTSQVLIDRWRVLSDRLNSRGLQLLCGTPGPPPDEELEYWFNLLHESEVEAGITLYHPTQLTVKGERPDPKFEPHPDLCLVADNPSHREKMLRAWHIRRWLAVMMSTASHSQDTGINLVDIAVRLHTEGLAAQSVFYLNQNKYDDRAGNRPAETAYDSGELGERNRLAQLIMSLAPGCRA